MESTNNKWLDEIHLTNDGGVIKRIYVKGDENTNPSKGQDVTVNYEGRL